MSKMERSTFKNLPTPTLLVTDAGVMALAPEMRNNMTKVFKAIRLGMDLDDFWDFGVLPRPQRNHSQEASKDPVSEELYERYFSSYQSFVEAVSKSAELEKCRVLRNLSWFVASIHYLEGEAISLPREYWGPETVQRYRESVALVWAMFLSSLIKDSSLDLYEVANKEGQFSVSSCLGWLEEEGKMDTEKLYTKRLYYGALVFQVVSDYGKRDFARKNFIPSFGGVGFEDFSENELDDYVSLMTDNYTLEAEKCGVDKLSMRVFLRIFPVVQKVLNMVPKSRSFSRWAYS